MRDLQNNSRSASLGQAFSFIKNSCKFQRNFSWSLLVVFFFLQYSVPILLVVLGSVTASRDQLNSFFQSAVQQKLEGASEADREKFVKAKIDVLVSRILFLIGLITILLGVVNNITRPSESYDISAKFHNKFCKFENELDLQLLRVGGLPGKDADAKMIKVVIDLLIEKNAELFRLIDEFNDARSLSPRQANIQALNYKDDDIAENGQERRKSHSSEFHANKSLESEHRGMFEKDGIT